MSSPAAVSPLGFLLCFACIGFAHAKNPTTPTESWAYSTQTRQLVKAATASRGKADTKDRQAAASLMVDGDRAYRTGDYTRAYRFYLNAYPNYAIPSAYLMSGDAQWRSIVEHQLTKSPPVNECRLSNEYFPQQLRLSLDQHFAAGLLLAEVVQDRRVLRSGLYKRAKESLQCLHRVAWVQQSLPPSACVDLNALQACLGPPLPLPTR